MSAALNQFICDNVKKMLRERTAPVEGQAVKL